MEDVSEASRKGNDGYRFLYRTDVSFKVLFVFVVLAHRRREVLHFNVTEHGHRRMGEVEVVADRDVVRYLVRDRD
jgi:hypothetical protein